MPEAAQLRVSGRGLELEQSPGSNCSLALGPGACPD